MAKGKKISGNKSYVSKGLIGKNKSLYKSIRQEKSDLDRILNAIESWKKGSPTPRLVQKYFGVTANRTYKDWIRPKKSSKEDLVYE